MSGKQFLGVLVILVLLLLTFVYFFVLPFGIEHFGSFNRDSNFSSNSDDELQFYPNMRYSDKLISYSIENCPLQKKDEMLRSLEILENLTILQFYQTEDGEIQISCDSHAKIEGEFFIAGEGGPEKIIRTSKFNVIKQGKVLLLRESNCETPLVGIHELLHALGFTHSRNPNNIMYNFSKCGQEIGQDVINKINEIYSTESLPDLAIKNAQAQISGLYLDANVTIQNEGLKDAEESMFVIYSGNSKIKEMPLSELKVGYGSTLTFSNIFVKQINVNEIKLVIESSDQELDKSNNEVVLTLKKN